MNNKSGIENGKKTIWVIVYTILALATIAMLVFTITRTTDTPMRVSVASAIAMIVLGLYYCFSGYKIPHGNLMRFLFVMFSVLFCIESMYAQQGSMPMSLLTILVGVGSAYAAGRLGRHKEAKIIMLVVLMALIAILVLCNTEVPPHMAQQPVPELPEGVIGNADVPAPVASHVEAFFLGRSGIALSNVFSWLVLSCAYLMRYKQHQEAGFDDAPINKK